MILRYRRHRVLRVLETWFEPPDDGSGADVAECHQIAEPLPGAVCTPFDTLILDLQESEETLFNAIKKDTRRDIRRAEDRDGAVHAFATDIDAFCAFYDRFAAERALAPAQRKRLQLAAAANGLALSSSGLRDAPPLVWHAYLLGNGRARLLYSAAADSGQVTGRINRFHHWRDIVELRRRGVATYDFGGWHGDPGDAARAGIDRFKEEFGGSRRRELNCTLPLTPLGKLYLALQRK